MESLFLLSYWGIGGRGGREEEKDDFFFKGIEEAS